MANVEANSVTLPFSIFVPGIAQPAGSKKGFVVRSKDTGKLRAIITDDAKKSRPWKSIVGTIAAANWRGAPVDEPLALSIEFTMPRPQSHYGTRAGQRYLRADAPHFHAGKPDATKLLRAAEDALTGIVWLDDSRIVDQHVRKVYGEQPGCAIRVRRASIDHELDNVSGPNIT